MNIILIGCVISTENAFNHLIKKNEIGLINLVGVLTAKVSKINTDFVDLSEAAKKNNVPVLFWDQCKTDGERISWINAKKPDLIFVIGWSKILSEEWIHCFGGKLIGFHPAKLPSNRGRHPIIWALILGLQETASTFFIMNGDVDDGPIISQVTIPILYQDDSASLYNKICNAIGDQIDEIVEGKHKTSFIGNGTDNDIGVNYWRRRGFNDGEIDWRMSSRSIYNHVRALRPPYPGSHFYYNDKKIQLLSCEEIEVECENMEPGRVLGVDGNSLVIKAGTNAIRLIEFSPLINPLLGEYLL